MSQLLIWPDAAEARPAKRKRTRKPRPIPAVEVASARQSQRYPGERVGSHVTSLSGQVSQAAWVFLVARTPEEVNQAIRDRRRLKGRGGYHHVLIEEKVDLK